MTLRLLNIAWLVLFLCGMTRGAIDPAELRCVDIQTNGDVILSWTAPTDPLSQFDAYQIYFSSSIAGPYALLGNVTNIVTLTYTHTGANAQTTPFFYYIVVRSNAPAFEYSVPSDTLQTIQLQLTNPANGTALLNWNPLHNPLPAGSGVYDVFAEFPAGVWTLHQSVSVLQCTDTIMVCNNSLSYRVSINNQVGCISKSSVKNDIFQNLIPPAMPVLDSVSVSAISGNAILGWQSSSSSDTKGYIIYLFSGGIWTPIDTVYGINNTYFENTSSQADAMSESYCIAALDSCGLTSPLTPGQTTMYLTAVADLCANKISLNWNAPSGFTGNNGVYEVFISVNSAPWALVGAVNNALFFENNGLPAEGEYCFKMQCGTGITTSSNKFCVSINKPDLPAYVYMRKASVNLTYSDSIAFVVDETVEVPGYHLFRAQGNGNFQDIKFFAFNGNHEFFYTDNTAGLSQCRYYIAVEDSCHNLTLLSDTFTSIKLSGNVGSVLNNEIKWTGQCTWPTGIASTELFRSVDGVWENDPLAILPGSQTQYSDDISMLTGGKGIFTYRIRWIENAGNPLGYSDTCYSDILTLEQGPRIFVPTAFTPNNDGINDLFIPTGIFVDPASYEFYIFDREDRIVFYTNDFKTGWDGLSDRGNEEKLDTYVYLIRLTLANGKLFEKRGIVTKVR